MINLQITDEKFDIFEPILKNNYLLVLNEKKLFQFYFFFYTLLVEKNNNITIKIGNKKLDSKNAILFSFCDFNEIIYNLTFKKGSLIYEYLESNIYDLNLLDEDIINYDLNNVIEVLIKKMSLDINYDLNIDLEKLIMTFTSFNFNYEIDDLTKIFNKIFCDYIKKNSNKIVIVFYNSNLFNFNFNEFDNCYVFDIGNNDLNLNNLIIDDNIRTFSINKIVENLEKKWPIEFYKDDCVNYIKKYFIAKKNKDVLYVYNEQEYLVYILMNKISNSNIEIIKKNFHIRDNIKSFLEHI